MIKKTVPLIPFYFIRHGQTEWNRLGIRQGQIDISLNDDGIAQAQSIVSTLSGKGISRIVSSPLMRAYKKAAIINKSSPSILRIFMTFCPFPRSRHTPI